MKKDNTGVVRIGNDTILFDAPNVVICDCDVKDRRTVLCSEKGGKLLVYIALCCNKFDILIDDMTRFIVDMQIDYNIPTSYLYGISRVNTSKYNHVNVIST